jgi:O-succinylbenzoic acid--CoA ligase
MDPWHAHPVPAMRREALYGDRVVRCFADRPGRVHAMFERSRTKRGGHEAIVHEGRRWTYAEAAPRPTGSPPASRRAASSPATDLLMLLSNRPEFLFVLLALQRLGAIAVPVGIREARPGLTFIAEQCGAIGIVFDDELAERCRWPRRRRRWRCAWPHRTWPRSPR